MKVKFLLLFAVFLFSIACVGATDVNDTIASSDVNDALSSGEDIQILEVNESSHGITISDDGTFTSLQKKIILASEGSTISLDRDYSYDEGFLESGIVIDKNLTINGNGHILDGKSKARIFMILFGLKENNKVTLNNIKFVNGHTKYYGGAILNFADLTVNKCTFTNNYAYYCGGAINSLGYMDCKNSNFYKNTAGGDGGAIFSLSFAKSVSFYINHFPLRIIDEKLEFINPITLNASFKFLKDRVSNCVFKNNVAKGRGGGAIYAFSNIDVRLSLFAYNKAGEKGGAIFANKDLYVTNSKFAYNKAPMYGGAIYFKCHESSGHYDKNGKWISEIKYYNNLIQGSTFAKNSASKGGAIYGFRTSNSDKIHCAKALKCTFTDNKASSAGRDIYGGIASGCIFNYFKLTLNTANVKKSAKYVVLAAKLTKGKSLIVGKTIVFNFHGKIYKAKTNRHSIAKVYINKNILSKLKIGQNVNYLAKFGKLYIKKTVKVKK
ncbi:hypothetical protein [uncultured Methanobrevibacter sp.]|uniref:hypothetical protein n=1 Tax=uncultured Methanobrevibacter sp. TaxID=253161 RepID=UPI0025F56DAF|nr:hypothetical protein [uncultured Methanobrevibacter sp.]